MRVFTRMRELLLSQKDLVIKIEKIESKLEGQSHEIQVLFEYLKKLMPAKEQEENQTKRKPIGYKRDK